MPTDRIKISSAASIGEMLAPDKIFTTLTSVYSFNKERNIQSARHRQARPPNDLISAVPSQI